MGKLPHEEMETRGVVEALARALPRFAVDDPEEIRANILQAVDAAITEKLSNVQDGEALAITFRLDIIGANHKVRGGKGYQRNMPAYREWRTAVYERDGYTCQECGAKSRLVAHHLRRWADHPEGRFDLANGVTLCRECHVVKHLTWPSLALM
jgi:hypothetical protein